MNKHKLYPTPVFGIILLFTLACISLNAFAELRLPSGADRAPNLSLDPFERARDSIRRLPTSEPKEETKPQKSNDQKQAPAAQPRHSTIDSDLRLEPISPVQESGSAGEVAIEESGEPTEPFSQEFVLTVDWFARTAGGILYMDDENGEPQETATSAMPGLLEYTAQIDTDAMDLWKNGTFFAHLGATFGSSPSQFTGALQAVSSIDPGGPPNLLKVLELWYEHSFPHSNSQVLIGVHDTSSEFVISEYANFFVNSAPGMGTVVSVAAGPSAYPATTFGVRFFTELSENTYLRMGAYDGVATDYTKFLDLNFSSDEGVFGIAEAGYVKGEPGSEGYLKVTLGGWYLKQENPGYFAGHEYDDRTDAIDPVTGEFLHDFAPRPGNAGTYFLAETSIGETLGLFFKTGRASKDINRYTEFYTGGFNYTGLIPGRPDDVIGAAAIH
ncbi:MAG: carbohydrate porin, partial [Gammaproteobacteria bacterium]|nr:carbohydrate porin [Gammaproteobacteria bacterium]